MKIGENGIIVFSVPDVDLELINKAVFTFQGYGKVQKTYPSDNVSYDHGKFFIGLNQQDTMILASDLKIMVSAEAQINYKSGAVVKTNTISFLLEKTLATEIVEGNTPSQNVAALELHYQNGQIVIGSTVEVTDEQIRQALPNVVTTDNIDSSITDFMNEHPEYQGEKGDKGEDGTDGTDGKSAYQVAVDNGYTGTEAQWIASLHGQDGTDGQDGNDGKSAYESALDGGFDGTESEFGTALSDINMTKANMLAILRGGEQ